MRYYRCKCGKREIIGSDYPMPCQSCSECGTTIEGGPGLHKEPEPHAWQTEKTFKNDVLVREATYCSRCGERKITD